MRDVEPEVVVLYGGVGGEREVSLRSGAMLLEALRSIMPAKGIELDAAALPAGLDPVNQVVFPALHGDFGEDGAIQALLADRGIHYAGSDAAASRLCIDKADVKALAQEHGLPLARGFRLDDGTESVALRSGIGSFGPAYVAKPNDGGSSVGIQFFRGADAVCAWWEQIGRKGDWLVEERIEGRELTVGILGGRAMGVVEIISEKGVYDYEAKYTPGFSRYEFPANVLPEIEAALREYALRIFQLCGCRDFSRVDFLLAGERICLLEINTIPGLTRTSLLPKSASCEGLDFNGVAAAMVRPCVERWRQGGGTEGAA